MTRYALDLAPGIRTRPKLALPAFRANGAVGAVTTGTTVSPAVPTYAEFDIITAILFCRGSASPFSMPAGWDEIAQIAVGADMVAFFQRRATASESAPLVTNAGRTSTNLLAAQLTTWSGCKRTGTPYEALGQNSSASGVLRGTPVLPTGDGRLCAQLWARTVNSASGPSGPWTENLDQGTGGGGACRFIGESAPGPHVAPACNRGGTGQAYAMVGFAFLPEGA